VENGGQRDMKSAVARRKKEQELGRRRKRRSIDEDSRQEHQVKENY
jgi:hypothetical protein